MLTRRDMLMKARNAFDNDEKESFAELAETLSRERVCWVSISVVVPDKPSFKGPSLKAPVPPPPVVEAIPFAFAEYLANKRKHRNIGEMLRSFGIKTGANLTVAEKSLPSKEQVRKRGRTFYSKRLANKLIALWPTLFGGENA